MTIYLSVIHTAVYLAVVIPIVILMSGIKMNNKSVVKINVFQFILGDRVEVFLFMGL